MASRVLLGGPCYRYTNFSTYQSIIWSVKHEKIFCQATNQTVTKTWDNGNNPTTTNNRVRLMSRKYQMRRTTAARSTHNHIYMMEFVISDDTSGDLTLVICSQNKQWRYSYAVRSSIFHDFAGNSCGWAQRYGVERVWVRGMCCVLRIKSLVIQFIWNGMRLLRAQGNRVPVFGSRQKTCGVKTPESVRCGPKVDRRECAEDWCMKEWKCGHRM